MKNLRVVPVRAYNEPVRKPGWTLIGCAAAAALGCANGSSLEEGFEQEPGSGGSGGGTTTSSTTSTSTTSSTGAGGEGGGGEGGSGTGGSCDYAAPAPCSSGEELPGIDGDTGSDVRTATGDTSRWFHVYVAEAVSSIIDYPPLSYTATLTSPPGMDYDLYVYTGDVNGPNCLAQGVKGTGQPEQVSATWGDTIGSEDGTYVTFEVRYVSGSACGPQSMWSLQIAGNTD